MPGTRKKRKQATAKRLIRPWHIGAVLAVGGALAVALMVFGGTGRAPAGTPTPRPTSDVSYPVEGKSKGFAAAPVTIVEYSDFQCPYCARFAQEIVPALETEYIATGKVRFEYKHLAQIGEESILAAEATMCALDQGRFWDFHDLLFANQSGENKGAFSRERLKGFASRLGLDKNTFDGCLGSDRYRSVVSQETASGRALGIRGPPAWSSMARWSRACPSWPACARLSMRSWRRSRNERQVPHQVAPEFTLAEGNGPVWSHEPRRNRSLRGAERRGNPYAPPQATDSHVPTASGLGMTTQHVPQQRRGWFIGRAIPALAILGAGISGYLTYTYWTAGSSFCGGLGNCAKVEASPYAHIRGVPVALLGLLMSLSVLGLGLWNLVRGGQAALLGVVAMSFAGVLFSAYLTYRSIFTIGSVCPWCVSSAVTVTAIFGLSLAALARETADNLSPSPATPSNLRKSSRAGR